MQMCWKPLYILLIFVEDLCNTPKTMMVLEEQGLRFYRARREEADNSKLMWVNNSSYYLTGSIWCCVAIFL